MNNRMNNQVTLPRLGEGSATFTTPSPPTKSFPTKSPRVELSGRLPIKLYGHENSHPLIKSLLESNPLKPKLLVGGLGVRPFVIITSYELLIIIC